VLRPNAGTIWNGNSLKNDKLALLMLNDSLSWNESSIKHNALDSSSSPR